MLPIPIRSVRVSIIRFATTQFCRHLIGARFDRKSSSAASGICAVAARSR
jgi:hypothetical protein